MKRQYTRDEWLAAKLKFLQRATSTLFNEPRLVPRDEVEMSDAWFGLYYLAKAAVTIFLANGTIEHVPIDFHDVENNGMMLRAMFPDTGSIKMMGVTFDRARVLNAKRSDSKTMEWLRKTIWGKNGRSFHHIHRWGYRGRRAAIISTRPDANGCTALAIEPTRVTIVIGFDPPI